MPRRNSKRSLGATHKSPGFTTRTAPNPSTLHKRTGPSFTPILCHTLQEDGVTRCSQGVKTKGLCHVHYDQYNLSLKSYKTAQERAQEIRNGKEMPSDRDIAGYTDGRAAVAELEWVTDYLQAIGEEKAGRESHSKRFYLKVNAGHKKRIDILTRRMRTANSVKRKLRDCILKLSVEGHPVTESEPPYHAVDQIIVTNNVPSLPIQEKFQHSVSGVFTAVDGAQSNDGGGDPYGISHRAHSLLRRRASQGRTLGLPESAEERFVAACHSYDELINVLSAGVFGKSRPPNSHRFLQKPELEAVALASRDHLSLCGVVIADLAWGSSDTVRTSSPPIRTGNVVWEQVEARSYLFGAVRYEEDVFVEAFLEELRKRPDLFQLLLWSETEPDAPLEETGSGPNGKALPPMRFRRFEAPDSCTRVYGYGEWRTLRTPRDILFSNDEDKGIGYITNIKNEVHGSFFRFKKFPVRYFVVLDTVPNRHPAIVLRNVAWAALKAGNYGTGQYTETRYLEVCERLLRRKRLEERTLPDRDSEVHGTYSTRSTILSDREYGIKPALGTDVVERGNSSKVAESGIVHSDETLVRKREQWQDWICPAGTFNAASVAHVGLRDGPLSLVAWSWPGLLEAFQQSWTAVEPVDWILEEGDEDESWEETDGEDGQRDTGDESGGSGEFYGSDTEEGLENEVTGMRYSDAARLGNAAETGITCLILLFCAWRGKYLRLFTG